MRVRSVFPVLLIGLMLAACGASAEPQSVSPSTTAATKTTDVAPAPELTHVALLNDGKKLWRERGQTGSWLVVNFWATWCGPCRAEMPILEAFAAEQDPDRARVVGMTRLYGDDPKSEVRSIMAYLKQQGITYPTLVAGDTSVHLAYGVEELPSTALLDPEGRLVDFGVGIAATQRILRRAAAEAAAAASAPAH